MQTQSDLGGAAMADQCASDDRDLAAGDFSSWAVEMQGAIRGEHGSDVPCDGCTACCTSSQFIHIEPDETDTLSRIPAELLFPAPGLPIGHVVLGYDERGHCPMLIDDKCSIYAHRPRACRTYDCRIFPAAGLGVEGDEKASIARQAKRWQFNFPTPVDRSRHDAVRAAAEFLVEHGDFLSDERAAPNSTRLAVLAIELHDAFLRCDEETGETTVIDPDPRVVRVELMRRRGAEMP
jgi:Fe-S-cluster containining protein